MEQQGLEFPKPSSPSPNTATNQQVTTTTSDTGAYRAIHLQPGIYEVRIDASGFAAYDQKNVVVEIGRITTIDPRMSVTGGAETVPVSGEAPAVNTDTPDFASNVNQVQINNLPINGRRWSNFALLTPRVAADSAAFW